MTPKVALFYDWINQWGGAERLLLDLAQIFPQAPIYTLVYNPSQTPWAKKLKILPSSLNKLPFSKNNPSFYGPFHSLALEQFNFDPFDIVITLTSQSGHSILTRPQTLHLNYCLTPNRYLYTNSSPLPKLLKSLYRPLDQVFAQRPDHILTTSQTVQKRIKKRFSRDSTIIYPGTDTDFFQPPKTKPKRNFFLVVSRLVPHKQTDLVVKTFNHSKDILYIVGQGRQEQTLRSLARSNIRFMGQTSGQKLKTLYQNAQALICPQEEDFGLTPLEAMACGTPVIAFEKGGHAETITSQTGILFKKQTKDSLQKTVRRFKKQQFHSSNCRHQALEFSRKKFMINFKSTVKDLWQKHQTLFALTKTTT